jgi:hypothetical protein
MKYGWPETLAEHLKVYYNKRNEMSVSQDCLMWGLRVIVPT